MKTQRHFGIDFLRIIATYMVIMLHVLGCGGILSAFSGPDSIYYRIAWLLEIAAYCAVNCYALISGYVGLHSKFKLSRLVTLWLQVVFYCLGITAFFSVWRPWLVSSETWINAITPIIHNQYWYMTAYFKMSIFVPLLNLALNKLGKKTLSALSIGCFICFMVYPILTQTDPFHLLNGYSTPWLCILYFIGGFIKKYDLLKSIPKAVGLLAYISAILLTWSLYCKDIKQFVNYTSPTIFIAALGLLAFFANMTFKNEFFIKGIKLLAPASLGVYIIHVHPLIYFNVIYQFAIPLLPKTPVGLIAFVLTAALGIYIACTILELARIYLFKKLEITKKTARIDDLVQNYFIKFHKHN